MNKHQYLIYIAGPMTGLPENNFPAFFEAEEQLIAKGWNVCNPASLHLEKDGHPWAYYMRHCIKALMDCTHLYTLPNWQKSPGARVEHSLAYDLSMPTYYEMQFVPDLSILR